MKRQRGRDGTNGSAVLVQRRVSVVVVVAHDSQRWFLTKGAMVKLDNFGWVRVSKDKDGLGKYWSRGNDARRVPEMIVQVECAPWCGCVVRRSVFVGKLGTAAMCAWEGRVLKGMRKVWKRNCGIEFCVGCIAWVAVLSTWSNGGFQGGPFCACENEWVCEECRIWKNKCAMDAKSGHDLEVKRSSVVVGTGEVACGWSNISRDVQCIVQEL